MESFLDRLLAERPDPAAASPRAVAATPEAVLQLDDAGRPTLATTTAPRDTWLPDVPTGPEAPRIAVYDTLTSPPRVIAIEE